MGTLWPSSVEMTGTHRKFMSKAKPTAPEQPLAAETPVEQTPPPVEPTAAPVEPPVFVPQPGNLAGVVGAPKEKAPEVPAKPPVEASPDEPEPPTPAVPPTEPPVPPAPPEQEAPAAPAPKRRIYCDPPGIWQDAE